MKFQELMDRFPDFKQLTDLDISELELNKVSVLDAPDFYNWGTPNELPLTSGYIFYKNQNNLEKLIALYKQYNIIGLGIKVDRYLKDIPQEVIDYANEIYFPIIFIPNKYSFSDIIIPVTNQIMVSRIEELQETERIIRNFLNLGIKGHSTNDVINYLYEVTKVDLVFINELMDETGIKGNKDFEQITDDQENTFTYPLNLGNKKLGSIILNTTKSHLSVIQMTAIEYAAKVTLLIYKEELSLQQVREDYEQDLVSDICNGNIGSMEELNLRSSLHGWEMSNDVSVVIFDIDRYKEKTLELGKKSNVLLKTRNKMYAFIIQELKNNHITYYTYKISDSYIFILEEKDFANDEEKQRIFDSIRNKLQEQFQFTFTIGQGETVTNLLEANDSYREATDTIKISRILFGDNNTVKYEDIEPYTLLADISQEVSSEHSILEPVLNLVKYDAENSSEYYQTFSNLISVDWNISKLAQKEFIHYNTARYRFKKIEKITNMDLSNGNNKFNLQFSFKLYQIKLGLDNKKN